MINTNDVNNELMIKLKNTVLKSVSATLHSLLNTDASVTADTSEVLRASETDCSLLAPCMFIRATFTEGFNGSFLIIFSQNDLELMLDQLMGMPVEKSEAFVFDDINISAVSEICNQMTESGCSVLSSVKSMPVSVSPVEVFADEAFQSVPGLLDISENDDICCFTQSLSVTGVTNGKCMIILPESITSALLEGTLNLPEDPAEKAFNNEPDPLDDFDITKNRPQNLPSFQSQPEKSISNSPAMQQSFSSFQNTLSQEELNNLQLLMNIPLELSIEIGSTQRKVDDILSFSHGTVVELDSPADAPVNVIVNGHLIAKGDVVVVDDHFAVRVTEVLRSNLIDTLRGNKF